MTRVLTSCHGWPLLIALAVLSLGWSLIGFGVGAAHERAKQAAAVPVETFHVPADVADRVCAQAASEVAAAGNMTPTTPYIWIEVHAVVPNPAVSRSPDPTALLLDPAILGSPPQGKDWRVWTENGKLHASPVNKIVFTYPPKKDQP